ncbi:MAG TPA: ABC transporter permease [Pyrinomonadaceae bacterium]|nr:ABC transporter permease [Pyrinomonadaceae bacterium]
MKSLARTPFGAIFQAEVLLNSKRVVPYAMAVLFGANACLWWGWGAAIYHGWATNSDYYIARNFGGFSFMTLPLFTALIMGDPVIRDYRTNISPLIFSKPVSRATYLLGKFFGNFFVLVCCQMAFPLTLLLLQGVTKSGMVVQPVRVVPYFKHFFFFVVISHLTFAAFYFTVGTLTRNAKIVYGLAASFYPLYITYQVILLKGLPTNWRIALDPMLFNWDLRIMWRSADLLNNFVVSYTPYMLANRALMLLAAAACLAFLYVRFSMVERFKKEKDAGGFTSMGLAAKADWLDSGAASSSFAPTVRIDEFTRAEKVSIPKVSATTEGLRANLRQLMAALGVEFRLLYAERSLVVLAPLATLLCVVGLATYEVVPDGSYSAAYAGRTAESLLLFLCAIAIFYTGEGLHRDRELRFEPVLWSVPAPNFVLLLSKFAATLLLSLALGAAVALAAIALQIYKGHTPIEITTYLTIYTVILIPSMVFLIATVTMLNVLLRDKYVAYAVSFAIGGGLLYLYNLGYNHWLYNPLLYGLWTPADFTSATKNLGRIITHRIYCLAVASAFLSLAHLFFERKSTEGLRAGGGLRDSAWSILILVVSIAVAVIAGLMIGAWE